MGLHWLFDLELKTHYSNITTFQHSNFPFGAQPLICHQSDIIIPILLNKRQKRRIIVCDWRFSRPHIQIGING